MKGGVVMSWLAENWDTLMTILNTIGLLIVGKYRSK